MADLSPLTYGEITGRFVGIVPDTADAGTMPDVVPMTGSVMFEPRATLLRVPTAVPPTVAVPATITATLDAQGDLQDPQNVEGIWLVATDGPTIPNGWTYRVTFSLQLNGQQVSIPEFDIEVPAGTVQDLAVLIPALDPSGGDIVPVVDVKEVIVGEIQPTFVGQGIWFKKIGTDIAEMWVEDGVPA